MRDRPPTVAAVLADERLVTIGDGAVEVAHEALLREWPRLRGWLDEDAEGRAAAPPARARRARLGRGGRDPGELYRGARLAGALEWAARHAGELNADRARTSSTPSRTASRAVAAAACGWRSRGVACLLVLTIDRRRRSPLHPARHARARQALVADAQRLGAQALAERPARPRRCCSRARASRSTTPCRRAATSSPPCSPAPPRSACWTGAAKPLISVAVSPDGRTARVPREATGRSRPSTRGRTANRCPSSRRSATTTRRCRSRSTTSASAPTAHRSRSAGPRPRILDARTHRLVAGLAMEGDHVVYSLHFSPDGRTVYAGHVLARSGAQPGRRRSSASTRAAAGRSGRRG